MFTLEQRSLLLNSSESYTKVKNKKIVNNKKNSMI